MGTDVLRDSGEHEEAWAKQYSKVSVGRAWGTTVRGGTEIRPGEDCARSLVLQQETSRALLWVAILLLE